ncbi:glycosyltransferase [Endozoicomonas euniceicola]|uniref:Glycosyltransferase n=1 Tax=Endozoicomonas euniceicola TaxID=1234143 RepID=A0ABY6H140_9GAMM|nr:glycosyltransferase [Endozoicomonas euniceicola]UYM17981.1 glycosyltransferase [Endozoicomonas euniceicola]
MSKDIIQSLWIGDKLSINEQLCINSFLKNGHQFNLYVYSDVKNIPAGTNICDARDILKEKYIFTYHNGSYAGFSDWFRHELIYKKGGFWVDTDIICLKPFDFDDEPVIFSKESFESVNSAVMKLTKGNGLSRFVADICKNPNTILPYDDKKMIKKKIIRKYLKGNKREKIGWGESGGPAGFTKALKHHNMFDLAKPFTYFFPVSHTNWDSIFDDTFKNDLDLFSDSYAIHLWNEMFRTKEGFDKNSTFSKNSLIEHLKEKYL